MGKHNYFVNKIKDKSLIIEHVVYGSVSDDEKKPAELVKPNSIYQAEFIHLDYIFEELPSTERIKGNGAVKTSLMCFDPEKFKNSEMDYAPEN